MFALPFFGGLGGCAIKCGSKNDQFKYGLDLLFY